MPKPTTTPSQERYVPGARDDPRALNSRLNALEFGNQRELSVVSQILVNAGVPNNNVGTNGQFYLRTDGGAGSCIYQKRGGVWVATGA
jgi:hypothetical protein